MNYTYNIFFTELRGKSIYTRVQINIEGETDPIIINFDVPGENATQEAINNAVQNAVAGFVLERTQAKDLINNLISDGSGDIANTASAVQDQINTSLEPVGLSATVVPVTSEE